MTSDTAGRIHGTVSELFCSVQGEGLYLGERQIFIRMAGCSGTCGYCDTPESKEPTDACIVYGSKEGKIPNPLDIEAVIGEVRRLSTENDGVKSVCLTGGEPLEQGDFVAAVTEALHREGFFLTLETNGTDPQSARKIVPFIDVIAMDMKLPSATGVEHWKAHRACLEVFREKDLFIKVVIDGNAMMNEFVKVVTMITAVDTAIPLILQPESGALFAEKDGSKENPVIPLLLQFQTVALQSIVVVRVIPQCHRVLGVR